MPCDTVRTMPQQTFAERQEEVRRALNGLRKDLVSGRARIAIAANGAVAFAGWGNEDRRGITDACAYRTLAVEGAWAFRQAVARAEAQHGRKVNDRAVAAGFHSHDGGTTWGRH